MTPKDLKESKARRVNQSRLRLDLTAVANAAIGQGLLNRCGKAGIRKLNGVAAIFASDVGGDSRCDFRSGGFVFLSEECECHGAFPLGRVCSSMYL